MFYKGKHDENAQMKLEMESNNDLKAFPKGNNFISSALFSFTNAKLGTIKEVIFYKKYWKLLKNYNKLYEEVKDFEEFKKMINGGSSDYCGKDSIYVKKVRQLFDESAKVQYTFNNEMDTEIQKIILENLLGKIGEDVRIWAPFHCDIGKNIEIGQGSFINKGCIILDCAQVSIGKKVLIGPGVIISTGDYPTEPLKRYEIFETKPIIIHDNVLVCAGVNIVPGVTIGENSKIGAGSVVTKDIPPNVFAKGNPCEVIRLI